MVLAAATVRGRVLFSAHFLRHSVAAASTYSPAGLEAHWQQKWRTAHIGSPEACSGSGDPFVMVLPPPNVTGRLHLGHALTVAVQDALARWMRLQGRRVLWLPGADHAGIATQTVVERALATQGKTRHTLGREAFLAEVWAWKEAKGGAIFDQLARLGASVDWDRAVFTLDKQFSAAVTEAFVRLDEQGLVYRDTRCINWSCALQSAISDIEVEREELTQPTALRVPGHDRPVTFGLLHDIAFEVEGMPTHTVVVSTTRPETLPGDVAVAVHPDDPRYTAYHDRRLIHPVTGLTVPIVLDRDAVDRELGTGAVKITPAHDVNDHAVGLRHKLPTPTIFTPDGKMADCSAVPESLHGMSRFAAREAILDTLRDSGKLLASHPHAMVVPRCSRSGDVVEPRLCPQWFVDCENMAKRANDAVVSGALCLHPPQHAATWSRWLEDTRPWCVSRQLWWGHRIPAYKTFQQGEEHWVVARSAEEARARFTQRLDLDADAAAALHIAQDEDVLDTWFSSAMGWPDEAASDYKDFFPGHVLETGHDILFFWVARMVMLSLSLTGQLPFQDIVLHAMVRDAKGRKMSKSLGNVIDPIDVIDGISLPDMLARLEETAGLPKAELDRAKRDLKREFPKGIPECGADALRAGLLHYTTHGRAINMDIKRVIADKAFGNKMWQAVQFTNKYAAVADACPLNVNVDALLGDNKADTSLPSRWLLAELQGLRQNLEASYGSYQFAAALDATSRFLHETVCDVYLEHTKAQLRANAPGAAQAVQVLIHALRHGLLMLSPAMPHLAEELYSQLPAAECDPATVADVVFATAAPEPGRSDTEAQTEMRWALQLVEAVRSSPLVYNHKGPATEQPAVYVACATDTWQDVGRRAAGLLTAMCKVSREVWLPPGAAPPTGSVRSPSVAPGCELYVDMVTPLAADVVDAELTKLRKQLAGIVSSVRAIEQRMADSDYARTPAKIRARDPVLLEDRRTLAAEVTAAIEMYETFQR